MAISRLVRFISFSVAVMELEDCCKWDLYKNVPVSTCSLNSVNAKLTFIFSNELGLMCALVRCGMAFKVTALFFLYPIPMLPLHSQCMHGHPEL